MAQIDLMKFTSMATSFVGLANIDPEILSGKLVVDGTRFPISRIFAELADGSTLNEIADEFFLDKEKVKRLFQTIALVLEESYTK